jgi:hypothetical protein
LSILLVAVATTLSCRFQSIVQWAFFYQWSRLHAEFFMPIVDWFHLHELTKELVVKELETKAHNTVLENTG